MQKKNIPMKLSHICCYVLISFVVCMVSACAQVGTPPEPVTITFAHPESPDWKKYQDRVAAFQLEHPHITVELTSSAGGELIQNPHSGLDAFIWWPDPSLSEGEIPVIQPLQPFLSQTSNLAPADFYPRSVDMFTWDDTLWALPAEIDMQLLYYNRELFDAHGQNYPQPSWTWNEFLAIAQALTRIEGEGYRTTGHYGLVSNSRWGDYIPFIYQNGSDFFAWNDPQLAAAIQWYADLTHVHEVMPQPKYVNYGDTYGYFREQKAAMWIGFLADRDGLGFHHLNAPWPFEWSVVPLPRGSQGEATIYRGQGYYISADTEHPEAAWAWIQYLSSHPLDKALPARPMIAESSEFQALVGEDVASAALHAIEYIIPRVAATGYPPEMLEIYARTNESVTNDGYRTGFYSPPAVAREFSILIEGVAKGELTAVEAIAELADKYQP
jgi:multiple sugar transport system substrate-binding protein